MITIEVQAQESFERIHTILQGVPGGVERALRDVVSRTTITVRSESIKAITSVYDTKATDIRDRKNTTINMRTKKTESGIVGMIIYSGGKIPLYRFGVKPKEPKRKGHKVPVNIGGSWVMASPGVTTFARQRKDKPYKRFDNVFIAQMKSGHKGMFERKGRKSAEIEEIMGASTPEMAGNSVVLEKVETAAMETIVKRTEQQISYILNGGGK